MNGPARPGRRTKLLVKRLRRGDIAVIDHEDLDRVSAEDLIAAGVGAVLNCRPSSTGTYPNMGPLLLVQAGIHLVDLPDDRLFDALERRRPDRGPRRRGAARGGELLATGVVAGARARARRERRRAAREIGEALEAFAHNTIEHMLEERELLAGKLELPRFDTDFRDRPRWSSCAASTTSRTCARCGPYIRDVQARCSSASTAAPTRCSRRASSRT